jgi:hypothetical protein
LGLQEYKIMIMLYFYTIGDAIYTAEQVKIKTKRNSSLIFYTLYGFFVTLNITYNYSYNTLLICGVQRKIKLKLRFSTAFRDASEFLVTSLAFN